MDILSTGINKSQWCIENLLQACSINEPFYSQKEKSVNEICNLLVNLHLSFFGIWIVDDDSSDDSEGEQATSSERLEVNKQPKDFASKKDDPNR